MKVKATHPMAKLIGSIFPECHVSLEKMSPEIFRMTVDCDLLTHTTDYNINTGKMQVIRIEYPAEYMALPQYVTTHNLSRAYRNSDGTLEGFSREIKRAYAI